MNVMTQMEFELDNYCIRVQHGSLYATGKTTSEF